MGILRFGGGMISGRERPADRRPASASGACIPGRARQGPARQRGVPGRTAARISARGAGRLSSRCQAVTTDIAGSARACQRPSSPSSSSWTAGQPSFCPSEARFPGLLDVLAGSRHFCSALQRTSPAEAREKQTGTEAVAVCAEARECSCALRFGGTKSLGFNPVLTP
jgi:hypothetical protein